MAAKKTKPRKCPFSNKATRVTTTAGGHFMIESSYGWKSKLFTTQQDAIDWSHTMKATPNRIVPSRDGHRFNVVGPGWFSELFQTREGAEYWEAHRAGRELKTATPPPKITSTPAPLDPDDPMADFADMKEEAAEFRAFNEEAVAKAQEQAG